MSHDQKAKKSSKKKSSEEKHLEDVQGFSHAFTSGTEDGKCVWHGIYTYKVHSCSYRYQSVERANSDSKVYNWPAYKEASVRGQNLKTSKHGGNPKGAVWYVRFWYKSELKAPSEGGWDLAKGNLSKGNNFYGPLKPYWNNPHHIIPVGAFNESLEKVAKALASTRAREGKKMLTIEGEVGKYIRESLLAVKYNINHKMNMVLLPVDDEVAEALRLPAHGSENSTFHPNYSVHLKEEVDKVMRYYQDYLSNLPDKEHLTDLQKQAQKDRLEGVSDDFYTKITANCLRGAPPASKPYQGPKWLDDVR